jgi:hypothetical protein
MSKKVFFIPLFASFLFFIAYLLLAQTGSFLSVEPGYSINDVSRWCERISGGYFREPSNALSNIGFITTWSDNVLDLIKRAKRQIKIPWLFTDSHNICNCCTIFRARITAYAWDSYLLGDSGLTG